MCSQGIAIGHWHVPRLRHGFLVHEEPPLCVLHLLALRVLLVVAPYVQRVYVRVLNLLIQRLPSLVPRIAAVFLTDGVCDIVVDAERALRLVHACELALWCERKRRA
jgi:hypothetical protein